MPDRRVLFAIAFASMLLPGPVTANSALATAARYFSNPMMVGQGLLSHLFWDVYKATLIAPDAKWHPDKPFALSVKYLLDIDGDDIAERTIAEIRDQGYGNEPTLSVWQENLSNILPNVTDGTRLTAVRNREGHTIFYRGGTWIGEVKDRVFTRQFFNIWLGEKTPQPALRRALLGGV